MAGPRAKTACTSNISDNTLGISAQMSEISFQIPLRTSTIHTSTPKSPSDDLENLVPESVKEEHILCVIWRNGKLGGAYYNSADSELYLIPDILDLSPEYLMLRALYDQIKPSHTLSIGTMASKFIIALASVATDVESDSSMWQQSIRSLPSNVQLLKSDEYSIDRCIHALETLKLPTEPRDASDEERIIYMHSVVNFGRQASVHALGALVLFLTKYRGLIQSTNAGRTHLFMNINIIPIQNIVYMDVDTYKTLQVFNPLSHPAAYNRGNVASNKEGLSIYKLFNKCRSSLGRTNLRAILLHPTNNLEVLKKRQQLIEFCIKPINAGVIAGVQDCLKYIFPITASLTKIYGNQSVLSSWKILYSTLHNVLMIQQLVQPYLSEVQIFREFDSLIEDTYSVITDLILDTIDFDNSIKNRVSVKIGVSAQLDMKKLYSSEVKEKINSAAAFEIYNLPEFIRDCSILYVPQIGYLVAVEKWCDNAVPADVEKYGFRHMFSLGKVFNFKSAVCDELDKCLGDVYTEIQEHESRIILKLSECVYSHGGVLQKPLKMAGHIDSLICMADVAKQLGYVRPNMVEENVIDIKDGRHALLEVCTPTYVPNSLVSGGQHPVIKIITGPNNSGKSIYLKQNALIVFLAHIGSYVPAVSATIGLMHGIYCSRSTSLTESASCRLSTFAADLRQMSQAMHGSEKNSLILIDEFGRATTELDGLALLAAYLEQYLFREEYCPHILVSTHFIQLTNLLPESQYLEHLKCDHKIIEDNLIFLYKLVSGISRSFAIKTAANAGLPAAIVKRSEEIFKCYTQGLELDPINIDTDDEDLDSSCTS
ncbi:spellchecker1 [Carabus blaptoides fortunei]